MFERLIVKEGVINFLKYVMYLDVQGEIWNENMPKHSVKENR